jgi:hypothetical protein
MGDLGAGSLRELNSRCRIESAQKRRQGTGAMRRALVGLATLFRTRDTCVGDHSPPRGAEIPRSFSFSEIPASRARIVHISKVPSFLGVLIVLNMSEKRASGTIQVQGVCILPHPFGRGACPPPPRGSSSFPGSSLTQLSLNLLFGD